MNKVFIAVPTFETIHTEAFKSIYNLDIPRETRTTFEAVKGYDCARARNQIIKNFLETDYDYLLMVDSDIILPEDTLHCYLSNPENVVLGFYPRKCEPDISEIFKLTDLGYRKENRYTMKELDILDKSTKTNPFHRVPVNGGGFGCSFITRGILENMNYPYFEYVNYPNGDILSEDLYFCSNARHLYPIYVDTRIRCKHIAQQVIA